MEKRKAVSYRNVDITGGFWAARQEKNRDVTVYAVEDRFDDTGRFEAFRFDYTPEGDRPKPHYFWDSDVAKWVESAAYLLAKQPNERLRRRVDEVIENIAAHQDENGYFNIYHTVVEPENRFRLMDHHELYCFGHLLEAAVALAEGCGDDRLLTLMRKYAVYIETVFVKEKSAAFTVPGHEEIELALYRAYDYNGDELYRRLADHFINERGRAPRSIGEWCLENYCQNHLPVRRQREAMGHCVRACYLYSGMADGARHMDDEELFAACRALFEDITLRKMYVTGGVGSSHRGEAFTIPFDLPNDTAYAETCAAISLAMFANRMKDLELDGAYADTVERTIYNGILSGVSLDGKAFFYENPLEINLADRSRHTTDHNAGDRLPITERQEVFGCSCCPPNVTRLLASLGGYLYSEDEASIVVHQYMQSEATVSGAALTVKTDYPKTGTVRVAVRGGRGKTLYLRIPGWCRAYTLTAPHTVEKGYAKIAVPDDDFALTLTLDMPVTLVSADPRVRAAAGKVAVTRGPVVYCLEGHDCPVPLFAVRIPEHTVFTLEEDAACGVPALSADAAADTAFSAASLYLPTDATALTPCRVRLIPYFAFANRGPSDMRVWLRK